MKNKNYIVYGVVVVILVLAAFFIYGANKNKNKSRTPAVQNNTSISLPVEAAYGNPAGNKRISANPSSGTQISAPSGVYVISYVNSGFYPGTLEVSRGASVRFINNSTKAMRVTSADTTNNPLYQTLNQPKTVGKGGYYDYNFVTPGVYAYTNSLNTADTGTITVK